MEKKNFINIRLYYTSEIDVPVVSHWSTDDSVCVIILNQTLIKDREHGIKLISEAINNLSETFTGVQHDFKIDEICPDNIKETDPEYKIVGLGKN